MSKDDGEQQKGWISGTSLPTHPAFSVPGEHDCVGISTR